MEPGTPGVSLVPAPTCYRSPLGEQAALPDTSLYLELLEQQIVSEGPDLVAAMIAEPVMQANGVQVPPADYFPGVREICYRHGVLLIADEVITGFGRTGKWFAIEHWGVQPDMVTMAKAMTAGYMPLGAVTVREHIWEALPAFPDVHTFGGHAAAAVAAMAAIGIYEREGLIGRARETGEQPARPDGSVGAAPDRRRGSRAWVMGGGRLHDRTPAPPAMPPEEVRRILISARRLGLIATQNGGAIEIAPRLDVPEAELEEGVEILDRAIGEHPA